MTFTRALAMLPGSALSLLYTGSFGGQGGVGLDRRRVVKGMSASPKQGGEDN